MGWPAAGRLRPQDQIALGGRLPGSTELDRALDAYGAWRWPSGRARLATNGHRRRPAALRHVIGPGLKRLCIAAFGHSTVTPSAGTRAYRRLRRIFPGLRPVALARFDPTTALIVVDVQNDFADPGGLAGRAGTPIR